MVVCGVCSPCLRFGGEGILGVFSRHAQDGSCSGGRGGNNGDKLVRNLGNSGNEEETKSFRMVPVSSSSEQYPMRYKHPSYV